MVKTSEMSIELKQELAFTKEELAEPHLSGRLNLEELIRRVTEWMPMGHNHNQEKNIQSVGKPYKAQIGSEPTETLVGLIFL